MLNLPANDMGRSLLRLELQHGLMIQLNKMKQLTEAESHLSAIVNHSLGIKKTLWKNRGKKVSFQTMHRFYEAAVSIIELAEITMGAEADTLERLEKLKAPCMQNAAELKRQIGKKTQGSATLENTPTLVEVSTFGQIIITILSREATKSTRFGFKQVENAVEEAFKAG